MGLIAYTKVFTQLASMALTPVRACGSTHKNFHVLEHFGTSGTVLTNLCQSQLQEVQQLQVIVARTDSCCQLICCATPSVLKSLV